jgi:hypothetical protein
MCRCEGVLYVQKINTLCKPAQEHGVQVHILVVLAKIGLIALGLV